jgi:hypothetical protein
VKVARLFSPKAGSRFGRLSRRVLLAALALFLALQLIPVDRTNPPVRSEVDAPAEVVAILRRACFDCHSHRTRWPWYSRVAPVSWWLISHVDHGRGDLNFSEWPTFDFELREMALHDIQEQVSTEQMPLPSYLILHPEARLSQDDRKTLLRWARSEL